jgi:hypothetical protein
MATTTDRSNSANTANPDITAQIVRALCLYAIAEFQSGHATTLRINVAGNAA